MSLITFSAEKNRVYVRKFDHEEAASRHAAGESVASLAAAYGVTKNAIYRVISPGWKERELAYNKRWRTGSCEECGGPAMRLIGGKKKHNPDGRMLCARCRSDALRERLRFDELGNLAAVRCIHLDCANGERWQSPENFTRGMRHREIREGGIHQSCRACQTRAKQRYRAANPDYRRTNGGHQARRRNGEAMSPDGAAEAS
jgi:hypothetical protein